MALSLAQFNCLVTDHGATLYRMAYRMVGDRHQAEDLAQETFRSAWKSRESYRDGGGGRAWLVAILRRRAADYWRKPRPPIVLAGDNGVDVSCTDEDPLRDELTDEMQRALQKLPKNLRETLLLVVVADLTHQEAADQLGIPLGTVLSRVSRARNRLRECFSEGKMAIDEVAGSGVAGNKTAGSKIAGNGGLRTKRAANVSLPHESNGHGETKLIHKKTADRR